MIPINDIFFCGKNRPPSLGFEPSYILDIAFSKLLKRPEPLPHLAGPYLGNPILLLAQSIIFGKIPTFRAKNENSLIFSHFAWPKNHGKYYSNALLHNELTQFHPKTPSSQTICPHTHCHRAPNHPFSYTKMCYNASLVSKASVIEEIYGNKIPQERFGIPTFFRSAFEHPPWPVFKQGLPTYLDFPTWGLIPAWTRTADAAADIRDKTINARYETISTKPSFRALVDRKRCGMLVDGFVEWRLYRKRKYPYRVSLQNGRPFLLAGLWDSWKAPGSDMSIQTFTVVTTEALGIPALVHNTKLRMPLILNKDSGRAWLDKDSEFRDIAPKISPLFKPLVARPVSPLASQMRKEQNLPEILEPHYYPELPPLEA